MSSALHETTDQCGRARGGREVANASARTRAAGAANLCQPQRQTHNYFRNGTLDLFAALNVATGESPARCKAHHRAQDFVAFLREIEASVAPMMDIRVVLDNLSAHKAPPVQRWLLRHPRVQFHLRLVAQPGGALLRLAQ
jgi:hypothetical protein